LLPKANRLYAFNPTFKNGSILSSRGLCQPPPPPPAFVFISVFLPTAGQRCMLTPTLHPTAATAMCDLRCCHRPCPCPCLGRLLILRVDVASSHRHHLAQCLCCHCPCCLLTLTLTLHPLAATASRDGLCHCCPCLPPRRRSMWTLHPTAATALRDCLCPCLPPCHWSTSRIDIDVASYRPHRHARSLSLSSSPTLSLSPSPVDVAHQRCILLTPLPCTIVVLVVVPTACRHPALTSHPPAASA
jgi:hypothetical protein